MNIQEEYRKFCELKKIKFQLDDKVNPYNDTTLFCPAGMQQFKKNFNDKTYKGTIGNIQSCIRMNDFDEIGDGSHLLYFNMIGLFSFRELSIKQAIDFWLEFLEDILSLKIDYVTIHPDKFDEWKIFYDKIEIRKDLECFWTDGEIGGYCTEFYIDGVEIGNIVNPLDDCIDVGFGLERLNMFVNPENIKSKNDILKETIVKIINSGYKPSPKNQGYVLRKLLRELYISGGNLEHPMFYQEIERQEKSLKRYNKLKEKHKDKTREWWFDTHGIDLSLVL